jgi:hypothetical protein
MPCSTRHRLSPCLRRGRRKPVQKSASAGPREAPGRPGHRIQQARAAACRAIGRQPDQTSGVASSPEPGNRLKPLISQEYSSYSHGTSQLLQQNRPPAAVRGNAAPCSLWKENRTVGQHGQHGRPFGAAVGGAAPTVAEIRGRLRLSHYVGGAAPALAPGRLWHAGAPPVPPRV